MQNPCQYVSSDNISDDSDRYFLFAKIMFFTVKHKFFNSLFVGAYKCVDNQCVAKEPVLQSETGCLKR